MVLSFAHNGNIIGTLTMEKFLVINIIKSMQKSHITIILKSVNTIQEFHFWVYPLEKF